MISEFLLKESRNTWPKVTQKINIYQKRASSAKLGISHLLGDESKQILSCSECFL